MVELKSKLRVEDFTVERREENFLNQMTRTIYLLTRLGKDLRDGYAIALFVTQNITPGSLSAARVSDVTQPHATHICNTLSRNALSLAWNVMMLCWRGHARWGISTFIIEKSNGQSP